MILTTAQLQTIKAHITASGDLNAQPANDDGHFEIARLLNLPASPNTFWVWRTNVSRAELYTATSDLPSSWEWNTYKAQSQGEQGAWTQMFMGDRADFSKLNLREGIGKIFGASNAQTLHCLALGRRLATRIEKLLATGTGTTVIPALIGVEGTITPAQVQAAREIA